MLRKKWVRMLCFSSDRAPWRWADDDDDALEDPTGEPKAHRSRARDVVAQERSVIEKAAKSPIRCVPSS